jgi:hypothetical protein
MRVTYYSDAAAAVPTPYDRVLAGLQLVLAQAQALTGQCGARNVDESESERRAAATKLAAELSLPSLSAKLAAAQSDVSYAPAWLAVAADMVTQLSFIEGYVGGADLLAAVQSALDEVGSSMNGSAASGGSPVVPPLPGGNSPALLIGGGVAVLAVVYLLLK